MVNKVKRKGKSGGKLGIVDEVTTHGDHFGDQPFEALTKREGEVNTKVFKIVFIQQIANNINVVSIRRVLYKVAKEKIGWILHGTFRRTLDGPKGHWKERVKKCKSNLNGSSITKRNEKKRA